MHKKLEFHGDRWFKMAEFHLDSTKCLVDILKEETVSSVQEIKSSHGSSYLIRQAETKLYLSQLMMAS